MISTLNHINNYTKIGNSDLRFGLDYIITDKSKLLPFFINFGNSTKTIIDNCKTIAFYFDIEKFKRFGNNNFSIRVHFFVDSKKYGIAGKVLGKMNILKEDLANESNCLILNAGNIINTWNLKIDKDSLNQQISNIKTEQKLLKKKLNILESLI